MHSLNLRPAMSALLQYYSETGEIPSRTGLAALWGYKSRAWADRVAGRLVEMEFLVKRANGRLAPGARFDLAPLEDGSEPAGPPAAHGAVAQARLLTLHFSAIARHLDRDSLNGENGEAAPDDRALFVLEMIAHAAGESSCSASELRMGSQLSQAEFEEVAASLSASGLALVARGAGSARMMLTQAGRTLVRQRAAKSSRVFEALMELGDRDRLSLLRVLNYLHRQLDGG